MIPKPHPLSFYVQKWAPVLLVLLAFISCDGPSKYPIKGVEAFDEVIEAAVPRKTPALLREDRTEVRRTRYAKPNMHVWNKGSAGKPDSMVVVNFFDSTKIAFKLDSIVHHSDSLFSWYGHQADDPLAFINVAASKDNLYAHYQTDSTVYEILPISKAIVQINEVNQLKFAHPDDVAPIFDISSGGVVDPGYTPPSTVDPRFTVLVLASNPIHGMGNDALWEQAYEDNINSVFQRYFPTTLHADVIYRIFDYNPVGRDFQADLNFVRDNPDVRALRDEVKADIVSMLVFGGDHAGKSSGLQDINLNQQLADVFSEIQFHNVVDFKYAICQFTLAHEIAHNLGAGHDREAAQANNPFCFFGSQFPVRRPSGTTMSLSVMTQFANYPGCPRLGVLSNPQTLQIGQSTMGPMGHACDAPPTASSKPRDNLSVVLKTYPWVRQYR